jgi:hypothetical protein
MRRALRWLRRNSGTIAQVVALVAAFVSPTQVRPDDGGTAD